MGIKNEIDALRRQMLAECQRDVDTLGEVARVFMSIEEARDRGYAHLARVFAPQAVPTQQPSLHGGPIHPVNGHPANGAALNSGIYGSIGGLAGSEFVPTDPNAYDKAVAEAYGDHYAEDLAAAQQVAERFAPPFRSGSYT